jgi:hypothetical protein
MVIMVNQERGWRNLLTLAWLLHAVTGLPEKECANVACKGGLVSGNMSGPVHCFLRRAFEARRYDRNSEQHRRWVSLPVTHRTSFKGARHLQVTEEAAKLYLPEQNARPDEVHRSSMLHPLKPGDSIVDVDLSSFYPSLMSMMLLCPTTIGVHNAHRIWQKANTDEIATRALDGLAKSWLEAFCERSREEALAGVLERPCSGALLTLTLLKFCLKRLQSDNNRLMDNSARMLADLIKAIANSTYGFMSARRSADAAGNYLSCPVISALTTSGARYITDVLLKEMAVCLPNSKVLMLINDGFRVLLSASDAAEFDRWRTGLPVRYHGLLRFGDAPPRYSAALVRNTTHFAAVDYVGESRVFVRGFESRNASSCFRVQLAFDRALEWMLKGHTWQEIAVKLTPLVTYDSVQQEWKTQTRCYLSKGNEFGIAVDAKTALASSVPVAVGKRRSLDAAFAGWLSMADETSSTVKLVLDDGKTQPVPDKAIWYRLCVGRMLIQPLSKRVLAAVFAKFDRRKFVTEMLNGDVDAIELVESGMQRLPVGNRGSSSAKQTKPVSESFKPVQRIPAPIILRYGTSRCNRCNNPSWWSLDEACLNAAGVSGRSAFECNHCAKDVRGNKLDVLPALSEHGGGDNVSYSQRVVATLAPLAVLLGRYPDVRGCLDPSNNDDKAGYSAAGKPLWKDAVAALLWQRYVNETSVNC